jgi:hypothetical protein
MKLCTNGSIPYSINLQLKHQSRALDLHIQREIQVIELNPLRRRQSRKQALRHGIQIRSQRAHVDQPLAVRVWGDFGVARNKVVFNNEALTWPEVARVVKGYG